MIGKARQNTEHCILSTSVSVMKYLRQATLGKTAVAAAWGTPTTSQPDVTRWGHFRLSETQGSAMHTLIPFCGHASNWHKGPSLVLNHTQNQTPNPQHLGDEPQQKGSWNLKISTAKQYTNYNKHPEIPLGTTPNEENIGGDKKGITKGTSDTCATPRAAVRRAC